MCSEAAAVALARAVADEGVCGAHHSQWRAPGEGPAVRVRPLTRWRAWPCYVPRVRMAERGA